MDKLVEVFSSKHLGKNHGKDPRKTSFPGGKTYFYCIPRYVPTAIGQADFPLLSPPRELQFWSHLACAAVRDTTNTTWLVVLTILMGFINQFMMFNGRYNWNVLVGGAIYESQWEGWHPIYEMENTKCSKPPTSHQHSWCFPKEKNTQLCMIFLYELGQVVPCHGDPDVWPPIFVRWPSLNLWENMGKPHLLTMSAMHWSQYLHFGSQHSALGWTIMYISAAHVVPKNHKLSRIIAGMNCIDHLHLEVEY